MARKTLAAVLGWLLAGFTFIFSAIVNAILNLPSVPPLMEGLIYELVVFGFVGVAFVAIGLHVYVRASRAETE